MIKSLFNTVLMVYLVFVSNSALGDGLRLTETSITENGHLNSLKTVELQTKGYGFNYILANGLFPIRNVIGLLKNNFESTNGISLLSRLIPSRL